MSEEEAQTVRPPKVRGWSRRTRRRWASVCKWLQRSRRWAAAARRKAVFRPPPDLPVELPQHDPDPARVAELVRAKKDYELIRIAEKLNLPVAWDHRTVKKLPRAERYSRAILPPKLALVIALGKELFGDRDEPEYWASLKELDTAYLSLGFPPVRDFWESDIEFARLRVHGPNPVWLRGGWDGKTLRKIGLTDESATAAGLPPEGAAEWKDIYAVDYQSPLAGARPTQGRYLYPCIALFRQDPRRADQAPAPGSAPSDADRKSAPPDPRKLRPVGIQFQLPDGRTLWRPADGSPAWKLAKIFFGSADIFVHEIISHWMWTHVVAEKFIIHTARNLSWRHPLRRLLAPHLTSTLAMNANATAILVGEGGTFDTTFAGAAVKAALVEYGDAHWSYEHMVHPRRVKALAIDDLGYHPFRDDGAMVWEAIEEYVTEALRIIYPVGKKAEAGKEPTATPEVEPEPAVGPDVEKELLADTELAAWWAELRVYLGKRGFPATCDRAALTEVVTAILFNPVHHALVNSLQFDVYGWPPLSPPTLEIPMPEDPAKVTDETLLDALPSVGVTLDTIRSTYGFSAQYDEYGKSLEPFHEGWSRGVLRQFQGRLGEVVDKINQANLERGVPYRVCRPDLMGNSIDA